MSTPDPKRLIDGFSRIRRGVHSGLQPDELERDQLSFAVNTVLRTGKPAQRPAILSKPLTFNATETLSAAQVQAAFEAGMYQGSFPYRWADNSLLAVSISGRFYICNPLTMTVTDMGMQSEPWPTQVWFEQAEQFLIRQDGGWSRPLIFDGTNVRESNPDGGEVPGGRMMKYALGRLWLVLPDGQSFIAGDLVYGPSGTLAYNFRDSVLKFTENTFLAEGGAFTVGDQITAMRSQATIDTTLGEGPLAVFFKGGAALVNAPFDRTLWQTVTYPIQTIGALSHGALGQGNTINVNNDIWYRADDGIRSFKAARRDDDSWGDTPMSYEMDRVMRYDQLDLMAFGSAVLWDNRLLMTASPVIEPLRGVTHRGLISLDFQQASSLQRDHIPAYDGIWTGLRTLSIQNLDVANTLHCYVWAIDANGKIALFEVTRDGLFDGDGSQRVQWWVETPAYDFGFRNVATSLMNLRGANVFRSQMVGEVDFALGYRADEYPIWQMPDSWAWSDCATRSCLLDDCTFMPPVKQYRPPKLLSMPPDECEEATSKSVHFGQHFQMRLEVTGPAQIDIVRPWAYDWPEGRYQDTPCGDGECEILRDCGTYLFDYQITT